MAATAVFSSPAMHRLCSSLESSVDSPTTQRRELKYECQSIAHFCIYNKLKTHPLAQAGSLAIPPVGQISPSMHRVAKVVQRVAGEVEKRYNTQFNDMCCKLRLTTTTAYATFAAVANEMFSSGVNWGRIAALFAFVTSLAWSLTERGHIGVVERMPDWVAQFVEKNVGEWIASKGSWNAFVQEFERKCPDEITYDIENTDCGLTKLNIATLFGLLIATAFLTK
ncbi:apoptosis regulator R1-like [Corticium candelabrum]|uniref:apoptosis regulator R1-like n=1 Tax=Corticium candelabrum TaxID=121492 RepID=UPI002E26BBB3|nr:apoptosis regulator R1-like [Corticium candelabrum]